MPRPLRCALIRNAMSDSEKTEADSTTTAEQYEKEDSGKSETPLSTNGKPENNLSVQLEEKIIRQVEVRSTPRGYMHELCVALLPQLTVGCELTLE